MLDRILAILLFILVFVVIIMVSKLRELYKEKKLRDLVSFSVIGDYCPPLGRYSYVSAPYYVIMNAQNKYGIKKEYCITEKKENKYMHEIIEEFQKEMARSYFKGELKTIKSKYIMQGENYFMLLLHSYLQEHQCDYNFLGYDMHNERISYKEYDGGGYMATDTLTEFAVTYHKMYYIAHVYCKNCKPIVESEIPLFDNEKSIEKILDTKQIEISCYRH